jgi:hypothetical protein
VTLRKGMLCQVPAFDLPYYFLLGIFFLGR